MADKKISALTAATTPLAGTEVLPIVQGGSTVKVSAANLTAGRDISTTGITVSSNTGNIELNWAAGSTHKVGSTFSTSFFTGMRVDADTRNTDIISLDASGIGNVRIRTGPTETTQLNVDPTGNVTVSTGNLVIGTAGKGIDFSAATHSAGMTSELLNDYEEGTWTPVFASAAGSITSYSVNSATYTKVGRLVTVNFDVTITNNGTGTAGINITGVPFTVATAYASSGVFREVAATGNVGAIIASSGTNLQAANYDNAYAGGTNYRLVGTFSYNA
jgi:hypothetical protein